MVVLYKEKINIFFFGSYVLSNFLQVKPVRMIILGVFNSATPT